MPKKIKTPTRKNSRRSDHPAKTKSGFTAAARADESKATTAPTQTKGTKPVSDVGGKPPSAPSEPSPTASPRSLKELASTLGLTISPKLLSHLEEHGIHTVEDVRKAGGVGDLAGVSLSADDTAAIRLITAHANLSVLTSDERLRGALVAKGYASLLDVTKASRADFVTATHDALGDFKAAQLYEMARAQVSFLENLATGFRADAANGFLPHLPGPGFPGGFPDPTPCICEDCQSAVSPLAYLVDLLDYATKYIKPSPGLKGEYYDNIDFTNLKLTRADATVNFDWGTGAPDPSMQADTFSVRWTGWVLPKFSEIYTFYAKTDDGVRLWVDGQQIIDNWKDQPPTEKAATKSLTAGQRYPIQMDYYEDKGGAVAQLSWSSPSEQPKEIIPASQLSCGADAAIDAQGFADLFHQPFADLPASCESVKNELRQVRICIEVLRAHLKSPTVWAALTAEQQAAYAKAGQDYALAAYQSLLTKIGTSLTQIRLTGDDKARQALADRIGIDVSHLDDLFLDPNGDPTQPGSLSEAALETLFGLVDTNHDPLQPVAISDFETWRKDYLRALWRSEDWPEEPDPAQPIIPLIDPDLIGEGDLANPSDPTVGNPADLLKTRRAWVETQIAGLRKRRGDSGYIFAWNDVPGQDEGKLKSYLAEKLGRWVSTAKAAKSPDSNTISLATGTLPRADVATITLNSGKTKAVVTAIHNGIPAEETFGLTVRSQAGKLALYDDTTSLDAVVQQALSVTLADLTTIDNQRKQGTDITARLDQLSLSIAAFNYLIRIRDLALRNAAILDAEWESVSSILVQAEKLRMFAAWRDEEKADGLTLGPDYFTIPVPDPTVFPPEEEFHIEEWRAIAQARREWQDKLQSRIDQENAAVDGLHRAVSETEETTLPVLRDALVFLAAPEGIDLESSADLISERFLIDAKDDGCRMTTRVTQAIETLQLLLWSGRTGQLETARPELEATFDDGFEEDWQWIGSYATWRAAMFVFLYPENILLPGLRKESTPAFREFLGALRSIRTLTPERARQAAKEYADYFRDVCSLQLEVYLRKGDDRAEEAYLFARSSFSNKAYWSYAVLFDNLIRSQTFWDEIPGLTNIANLIGVSIYARSPEERSLYLFLRTQDDDKQKLVFTKYDLNRSSWTSESTELELPENATAFTARVKRTEESEPPHLGIRIPGGASFGRSLNRKGLGWDDRDFDRIGDEGGWRHLSPVHDSPLGADVTPSTEVSQARDTVTGDFDGDGIDELAVGAAVWADSGAGSNFWVVKYDNASRSWLHLGDTNKGARFDFSCDDLSRSNDSPAFAVVGDFDGDGQDEIAVAKAASGTEGNDFWVMKYDKTNKSWGHLGLTNTGSSFDFDCSPSDTRAAFAVAGDFDGDGHTEIAVARAAPGTEGNDFWVMKYDKATGWGHLGLTNTGASFDFDCSTSDKYAAFAVAGDFDGDGRDEIAVAPSTLDSPGNDFWVMKYDKTNKSWGHLGLTNTGFWADFDCSTSNYPAVKAAAGDFDGDGRAEIAIVPDAPESMANDCWVMDFDRTTGTWQHLGLTSTGFWADFDCSTTDKPVRHIVTGDVDGDRRKEVVIAPYNLASPDFWVMDFEDAPWDWQGFPAFPDVIAPICSGPFEITEQISSADLQSRHDAIKTAFDDNSGWNLTYLAEAWFFVPLQIALQLQQAGQYTAALDWLRTIYDYSAPLPFRKIYDGLRREETNTGGYERSDDWLRDPLNPHAIAATRPNTYTRYTLMSLIRCFLDFADAEFTRDTAESNPRARALYLTALDLLDAPEIKQQTDECQVVLNATNARVRNAIAASDSRRVPQWRDLKRDLARLNEAATLKSVATAVEHALAGAGDWQVRFSDARAVIARALSELPKPPRLAVVLRERAELRAKTFAALFVDKTVAESTQRVSALAAEDFLRSVAAVAGAAPADLARDGIELPWLQSRLPAAEDAPARAALMSLRRTRELSGGFVPALSTFCAPRNPILRALRLHDELNLHKLRTCRNIAGMRRELEPYTAPTDSGTGMPSIGGGGQLVLPGAVTIQPTQYRYAGLIERAKQLVSLAQQIEAAYLSALEKRDTEYYNLLKARQDVRLSRAGVQLQSLRVREAEDGVQLASLQQEKAQVQVSHYDELLNEGVSSLEAASLALFSLSALLQFNSALQSFYDLQFGQGESSLAASAATTASILSTLAGYERRQQQWEFDKSVAEEDVKIGAQQVKIADDHVRVAGQEQTIAEMQSEHAEAVVEFLANKFTNVELYDWMTGVLRRVYGLFLQHATAMAQLAANQLAFERQEVPPPFIQADYWEPPTDGAGVSGSSGPDRQGLTGSARLLADIYQLDQYAFLKNKRKLQLTETLSLARLAPMEFQRFREAGVLPFATPMELFDRKLPGNYLRLIRRLRTSVVALIPPTQGIRATLSSTGTSRVVLGGETFQTVVVPRGPESVTLTSPRDATGVFELDPQAEMLLPFEGMGVDAAWELSMPKAANTFDYRTVADVLVTIEYTALHSDDYRRQVVRTLDPTVSADRPFSFRQEFADAWYDLHNPDQTADPMVVKFETSRDDFPPNVDPLKIEQIVLYFAPSGETPIEIENLELRFTEDRASVAVGGQASTDGGVISTRRNNGASWRQFIDRMPAGSWELKIPRAVQQLFDDSQENFIDDILFVITFGGRTPDWPT